MIAKDALLEGLGRSVKATETVDGVRITTHCLYPSNSSVSVVVQGNVSEFVVTDDGGALAEIEGAGFRGLLTDRQMRSIVKRQGLSVKNGVIHSPPVSLKTAPAAILLVANAAKEVADWATGHLRLTTTRNFKKDLADLLQRNFHDNLKHDAPVVGASNKPHRFSHVVYLQGERILLIDPAVNDQSSINARVVANMDVRLRGDPTIEQLIVYDDDSEWSSASIKLLGLGARSVPFSQAEHEIRRISA